MNLSLRIMCLVSCLVVGLLACKDRNQGQGMTKAKAKQITRWAVPACDKVYKKTLSLCADFLKEKKRKLKPRKQVLSKCVQNTIRHPRAMLGRIRCMTAAPTCSILRHCQRCGAPVCPKWKKGPKVPKADIEKMQKSIEAAMKKKAGQVPGQPRGAAPTSAPAKTPAPAKAPAPTKVPAPAKVPAPKVPAGDTPKTPAPKVPPTR